MVGTTRLGRHLAIHSDGHCLCEIEINVVQNVDVGFVNNWVLAVTKFKADGIGQVGLLIRGKRIVKKLGMGEVLLELLATRPFLDTLKTLRVSVPL